jgi:hypothetical protein
MGMYNFTYSRDTIMIALIYKDVPYTLHYRAEKIFGQEVWKVWVTVNASTPTKTSLVAFTRASTDKELFRKLSDLNSFTEIQQALHEAFLESFKPEIINYLEQ